MKRLGVIAAGLAAACVLAVAPARADDAAAAQLFAAGDFDGAATAYAAVLAASPQDVAANVGLGGIRLYQNALPAAASLLGAALKADPTNARAIALDTELQRRESEAGKRATIAGGEADVPFVVSDPLPVIHATVNGKPGTFLVDTGGTLILDTQFAQGLGLRLGAPGTGVFAGGKPAPVSTSTIDSIALGTATAYDVPVAVMETHASELFAGTAAGHIDGIVGTTLFERFLVTIDYPQKRLVLRLRGAANSATFLAAARNAYAVVEPCWLVGDHFVIARAQVNDAPAGLFFFDSGLAGGGLMPAPALVASAKLALNQAAAGTGIGGGGAVAVVPFVAKTVAVREAVQQDVPGLYTPDGNPFGIFHFAVLGIISDLYLRHYAYTVDFDSMNVVFEYPRS